jgi:putative transposase
MDTQLDKASTGPHWLKDNRVAAQVMESIVRGEHPLHHYTLHAFVIMPNHVHLLIDPTISPARITNGLKGTTAREANKILRRTGSHFWQDESYDHWVRNGSQFEKIRIYIEQNPVRAGIATQAQDWPWSSASPEFQHRRTARSGCATNTNSHIPRSQNA